MIRDASANIVRRYLTEPVLHRYTNAGVRPQAFEGRSFALSPQGFADGMDDDAGTMTAWYVWSTLGLYPLTPGEPYYVVTAPQAQAATLRPTSATRIDLRKRRNGRLKINGRDVNGASVTHAELTGLTSVGG